MVLASTSSRGVSEGAGVAVLVVMTIVATASVGMTVTLVMDDEDGSGAEFRFDYSDDRDELLIFYSDGDELRAGSLVISGPNNDVTWAELDGLEDDEMVEPSNIPVRLSEQNAYDANVGESDFVEIRYTPESEDDEDAEEAVLATWNEPDEGDEDGPVEVPEN